MIKMSDIYKKPQSPLRSGDSYIYPLTTADQIILANGKRFEIDGAIQVDKIESCANADYAADAGMLDGKYASDFALASDVEQFKTQIDSAMQNTVRSVNGEVGEVVLTADDVGALTFDEDEILEDGVPIQVNAETFAGYTYDQFKEDIGLSIPDWALRLDPNDVPTAAEVVGMNAQLFNGMNYDSAKADILSETPVKSVNGKTGEITLNASDVGAATSNHGHADLMEAINKRFYHAGIDFSHYTTVNEAVNACTVDTSFFAVQDTNLIAASDSPFPNWEMQYFVMVDHNARRTVFAICYGNGRMATNSTFNKGAFRCNPWLEPYSSQNKPTYSDVGAASATHGHSNLDTLWKRWNSQTNVNHCTDIDNPVYNGM
jgi:hypothetical protein